MIYEFAIAPEIVNSRDTLRYFADQSGAQHGRLIARLPGKWEKKVIQSSKQAGRCGDVELKWIVERLRTMKDKFVDLGRHYSDDASWLENAEREHQRVPFRLIVSNKNPQERDFIATSDQIDDRHPLWHVERDRIIERTAENIAECAGMLLHISSIGLFIDPHFNPEERRFRDSLAACLRVLAHVDQLDRIELHTKSDIHIQGTWDHWEGLCKDRLARLVPSGRNLKIVVWGGRERGEPGDRPHARYILTDRGGIRYDYGLDTGRQGETTDVTLLDTEVYQRRWREYQNETAAFDKIHEVLISGTLTVDR